MTINGKVNLLLKTMEEMNGFVAKQDLELFHYYNEIYNGFQGLLLEIMRNYQYVGLKRKSGKNDQRGSGGQSGVLATLDEIIKTELPKEEKAMKKVLQFKKVSQVEEEVTGEAGLVARGDVSFGESPRKKMSQEGKKVESQLASVSASASQNGDQTGFIPSRSDQQAAVPSPSQPPNPQTAGADREIRASLSKAINSKPAVKPASLPERDEQQAPSYTIDPKMEKAIEINGDDGRPHVTHNIVSASERSNQYQTSIQTPQVKLLSIKNLTEFIDDFFAKKLSWDESQGDPQATRSSTEDFLFIHLKKKYGLPELIMQNALAVVDSAKQYAGSDHKISLFHHVSSTDPQKRD